jgi:hypothetical protein
VGLEPVAVTEKVAVEPVGTARSVGFAEMPAVEQLTESKADPEVAVEELQATVTTQ